MKLLIDRDLIELVEIKGKVELDSDVPAELAKVRVVHPDFVKVGTRREADDDLFIANRHDLTYIGNVLNGGIHGNNFGAWSGWRSVLVGDGNRGLYRLKGVSLNPRKPEIIDVSETEFDVFGGQSIDCAEYEKHMSDKFNKTLAKEGITPIMTCKGYWHFPKKIRGDKYSASVIKVEGDT
ncbi:MAG: hypothetical protein ACE5ES_05245, partial [Candidatus Nanoarchaeia archaeon]